MSPDKPRLVEFKPVPPGALGDLKTALRGLYLSAQPATLNDIRASIERLDEVVPMDSVPARDAIGLVIGDDTFPANVQHVLAVAAGLLHRHRTSSELQNVVVRGDPEIERIRRLWEQAAMERPLGRLIGDITPRDLMVSRTLDGTRMPPYIARAHDNELQKLVAAGTSGIAVLVSDSTSGKTRACFEALSGLGRDWRVWPTHGSPAEMLRDLPRVRPRTVVWLDEAQEYLLLVPETDELSEGLRELVSDPSRGPVLILGTVWPENRDALVRCPATRRLLDGCFIAVPTTFDEEARRAALESGDAQLAEAVRAAKDGAVVQYLAGVPDLMGRFESATATARALLLAAADARRFRHAEQLPRELLVAAAPGYLDDRERRRLTRFPRWVDDAFASLIWLGKGDMSPLHPSEDGTAYSLEDYLDQLLRGERRQTPPPESFWDACVNWTPLADARRVAGLAADRFLYDHAIALLERAAESGDTDALTDGAVILRRRDDLDGLLALADRSPAPGVLIQLGRLWARRGDADRAKEALARAEKAGFQGPAMNLMWELGRLDRDWVAQRWRDWANDGTVGRLRLVFELEELGLVDEAIEACRATLTHDNAAASVLLDLYGRHRGDEEIGELLAAIPALRDQSYHSVVRRLTGEGAPTVAENDIRTVAARLYKAGDLEVLRHHAAEHPDKVVHRHLTRLLLEHGFEDEAAKLAQRSKGASQATADFLVRQGRWADLGRLVAEGNHQAESALFLHLERTDNLDPTALAIKRNGLRWDGSIVS